jgi:hypothetical protein
MAFVQNDTGEELEEEEMVDLAEAPIAYRTRGSVIRFNRGCGAVEWRYVHLNVSDFWQVAACVSSVFDGYVDMSMPFLSAVPRTRSFVVDQSALILQ